jgi:hypothetical protein
MIAVVVAVVRSGRAFSGGATQTLQATWGADVSPPAWQQRLESLLTTPGHLADSELGAASIVANF